jgi:hypothetical protein
MGCGNLWPFPARICHARGNGRGAGRLREEVAAESWEVEFAAEEMQKELGRYGACERSLQQRKWKWNLQLAALE